jgi:hypothetical protein
MKRYGWLNAFLTSALDGNEQHKHNTPVTLLLGKEPLLSIGYKAGWAPKSIWALWRRDKHLAHAGIYTSILMYYWEYTLQQLQVFNLLISGLKSGLSFELTMASGWISNQFNSSLVDIFNT